MNEQTALMPPATITDPRDLFMIDGYDRVFSRETITTLLAETLGIVEEVEPPVELIHDVFSVAQQMLSTVQPKPQTITPMPAMAIPRGGG